MRRILNTSGLLLISLLTMVLASCSNDSGLIQSAIPSTSQAVAAVNGEKFFQAMDWKVTDGKLQVPADQKSVLGLSNETISTISELAGAVDYKRIYMVLPAESSKPYFVMQVKDQEALTSALTGPLKGKEAKATSPFTGAYEVDGSTALLRDELCWLVMADAAKAQELIAKELKVAEKGNYDGVKGISDQLATSDEMVRAAINVKAMSAYFKNIPLNTEASMFYYALSVTDTNMLVCHSWQYDDEGNQIATQGLQPVASEIFRYVPATCDFGFAAGITKDFDWSSLLSSISSQGGFQVATVAEAIKPYLTSIDGTVGIFGSIPTAEQMAALQGGDLSALQLTLLAHMSQQKINEAVDNIAAILTQMKVPTQKFANGTYSVTSGAFNLYFGSVDGYFAVSTSPLKGGSSNSLAKLFDGKLSAGFVDFADPAAFGMPLSYGFDIDFNSTKTESTVTVALTGTDEPILPTLITSLAKL